MDSPDSVPSVRQAAGDMESMRPRRGRPERLAASQVRSLCSRTLGRDSAKSQPGRHGRLRPRLPGTLFRDSRPRATPLLRNPRAKQSPTSRHAAPRQQNGPEIDARIVGDRAIAMHAVRCALGHFNARHLLPFRRRASGSKRGAWHGKAIAGLVAAGAARLGDRCRDPSQRPSRMGMFRLPPGSREGCEGASLGTWTGG